MSARMTVVKVLFLMAFLAAFLDFKSKLATTFASLVIHVTR